MKRIQQPEVTRDRDDQPVIDGVTYLRPSNLAKFIEDRTNLEKWKVRMTALGLARNPDLLALVSVTNDKWKLNDLAERAQERAGSTSGRDTGTAIHAATEAVDYGDDISHMPADLQADALAYRAARESLGLTPLAAEVFVVNSYIGAAGTFDRLVIGDGLHPLVTDLKTGSKDDPEYAAKYNAVAWSIQLATYAYATPHGFPWSDIGGGAGPNLDVGIVWYIPRGLGKCYPIHLDLEAGWSLAQTAKAVYDARKSSPVVAIHEAVSA